MQDRLNANVSPRQVSAWYDLVRRKINFGTYVFHLACVVRWCVNRACAER